MTKKKRMSIKYSNEDMGEIKTLIIITIIIVVFAVGLFFITEFVMNRRDRNETGEEPKISYVDTIIGDMFDKPFDEYYVFAFSVRDARAQRFFNIMTNYEKKEDSKWVYFADLNLVFNQFAVSEESNPKPTHPTEVRINEVGLFHIRDGKVVNFFEKIEDIEKALS